MYAIIKTGGKQYTVQQGDELYIEKLGLNEGESVQFDEVLAISNEDGLKLGTEVSGAKVTASVVKNGKASKVIIFKYKNKKDYRKKTT